MNNGIKENKMGVMPCGKLLLTMSAPMMISMLMQALYNVVDSIFVSRLGENALTSLSLAFPIQMLMIAVATGTGVGINALVSRRLGEKNQKDANQTAENGFFLAVMSWLVFALLGFFFTDWFFSLFTDVQEVIAMGSTYIKLCTIFSFGMFLQIAAERVVQATGNTIYNMFIQAIGAIINIVLDPVLIFVCGMGVAGAAAATVIGQIAAMGIGIYVCLKRIKEVTLKAKDFRPSGRIIKEIYIIGVPSIIMQAIGSVMNVGMNAILVSFSQTAVTVFGIYFKLQSFIFMPVFGLTNGMIPIVAYNYGARKKVRIKKTIHYSIYIALAIMILGTLIFHLFPRLLLQIFDASENMYAIGVPALRIISLCFPFAAVSIVLSSVFQAFGNGVLSLILSAARQLAIVLPVAYLLASMDGLGAIWYAFPIAECIAIVIVFFMYRYISKTYMDPMPEEA